MKQTITILMSTYNGEKYLPEQLESLCAQTGLEDFDVRLIVRDDGSKDGTVALLERWRDRLNLTVTPAANAGARASFFELLFNAPDSDYYAFCDQDDRWKPDKLSRSLAAIAGKRGALYFSNLDLMDQDGRPMGRRLLSDDFRPGLERILMCNPANGCTMFWDREMQRRLLQSSPDTYTMHDEYVCTLAWVLGEVVYDPQGSMWYRIHSQNVTQSSSLKKRYRLWKQIWFGREAYSLDKRARSLLALQLRDADRALLQAMADYRRGLRRFGLVRRFSCEDPGVQRSFRLRMLLKLL